MPILGVIASSISGNLYSASYDSIATVTVGAGGAANVEFTSIPSTYTHLQVRIFARGSSADNYFHMIFNSDTAANYSWHQLFGDGSTAGADGAASATSMVTLQYTNIASTFNAGIIDILDYKSTNKAKTIQNLGGFETNSSGKIIMRSGAWYKNAASVYDAVTSIKLTPLSGTISQYSSFALYGIKVA